MKAWLYEGVNNDTQQISGSLVKVETGIQNDDYVEILSGVSEGDIVLYTGSSSDSSSSMMMGMMYMFPMCMMMCAQKHDSPCFISI